jgi:hypothetical protein
MYRVRLRHILIPVLLIFIIGTFNVRGESGVSKKLPTAKIARWYNNCAAAISITYDHGNPASKSNKKINKFVIDNGLTMDYEIVTHSYLSSPYGKKKLFQEVITPGLGYFGHGHKHVNHDKLSYEEALASFKKCYQTMLDLGIKPIAYSYPQGAGHKPETRKALADSGFLCGRLHFSKRMTNPYIVPDEQLEPGDWFALPTLVMQDYGAGQCKKCVNNNEELVPYLDETIRRGAWIILTYHAVGQETQYGFFKLEEFKKNIYSIKERNFWNASMSAVTLYIRERLHAEVKLVPVLKHKKIKEILVTAADGLPNDIYDQPLTILLDLPDSWRNKPLALVEKEKIIKTFVVDSNNGMISIKPDEIERKIVTIETASRR